MAERPIVAIVGRPNVGKSTLFNRLAGQALAIVHDAPGVTRDRNYTDTLILGREVTLVDTGGFDPTTDDPMGQGIARHAEAAIAEADLVICVLDGSGPPTQPDRDAITLLRRSDKPVLYVANKIDGMEKEWLLADHYELGIPDLMPISALHGRFTGKLEGAISQLLPDSAIAPPPPRRKQRAPTHEARSNADLGDADLGDADLGDAESDAEEKDPILHVAFVGRPNAGKSSLFNRLSRSERSLVDDRPGTTRDPVDSAIEYKGKTYVIVDTAGIRRKSKVEKGVESASVMRSLRMIDRADVVTLMVDITGGIADQDARLLGLAMDRGKAIVVGLNKVDLVPQKEINRFRDEAMHELHFAKWTKVVPLSAHTGHGVAQLMAEVDVIGERMRKRVATSELNRFFEKVIVEHPPPTRAGKAPRIYYLTQTGTAPPTFVAFCSSPEHVAESYRRFVVNRIRQSFGYDGVPLRLFFRGRDHQR